MRSRRLVDVQVSSRIAPGRYLIDSQRTVVHVGVRKLLVFPVHGTFTGASGALDVAEDVERSRLVVAVPAETFTTRNPRRDQHVTGPAFLDVARFPALRFESSAVRVAGDGWAVPGTMVVHGLSAPVTFSARLTAGNGRLRVTAETTLSRSRFGVTAYLWLASDEIHVRVDAELHRAAQ